MGDGLMRKAEEFVEEYRGKGYPDERIRIIASMRPEPLRSEALKILDKATLAAGSAGASEPLALASRPDKPGASEQEKTVLKDTTPAAPAQPPRLANEAQPKMPVVAPKRTPPVKEQELRTDDDAALKSKQPPAAPANADIHKEMAALRKQRDGFAEQMSHIKAELKELRPRAAQVDTMNKQLSELKNKQGAASTAQFKLHARVRELQVELGQKQTLLAQKDKIISEMQSELAEERTLRGEASSHLTELQELAGRQSRRLGELGSVHDELVEANESLEALRTEARELSEREQNNVERVSLLEDSFESARNEVAALRREIKSSEQALDVLQEKLDARETELETLREHFENEALDLKKRADREMWMIRRKLSMFRRAGILGGAVAALLVLILSIGFMSRGGGAARLAKLEERVAALDAENLILRSDNDTLNNTIREYATTTDHGPNSSNDPLQMQDIIMEAPRAHGRDPIIEQPAPRYTLYVVKKGDNLWDIAKEQYGSGAKYKLIEEANNLKPHQMLQLGMELKIPIE